MSTIQKIAYYLNSHNDIPNQELAKELAKTSNTGGIKEIADQLWNKNKSIRSDCIKVLYEIGYIKPELIADHVEEFIALLSGKNNRMIWGGMIALSTIAPYKAQQIWEQIDIVIDAIQNGSVITIVNGVKVLGQVVAVHNDYCEKIFPVLLTVLRTCVPRDIPVHSESILLAVDDSNRGEFMRIIDIRKSEMKPSQLSRLTKIFKQYDLKLA